MRQVHPTRLAVSQETVEGLAGRGDVAPLDQGQREVRPAEVGPGGDAPPLLKVTGKPSDRICSTIRPIRSAALAQTVGEGGEARLGPVDEVPQHVHLAAVGVRVETSMPGTNRIPSAAAAAAARSSPSTVSWSVTARVVTPFRPGEGEELLRRELTVAGRRVGMEVDHVELRVPAPYNHSNQRILKRNHAAPPPDLPPHRVRTPSHGACLRSPRAG